jgi:hypothetical protein
LKINPVSLRPEEETTRNEKQDLRRMELESKVAQGLRVEEQLNGEQGQFFVNTVQQWLETRINQLVAEDQQCQAILKVLLGLGQQVNAGHVASMKLTNMWLGRNKE